MKANTAPKSPFISPPAARNVPVWPSGVDEKHEMRKATLTRRQFLLAGGTVFAWAILGGRADVLAVAESKVDAYTLDVGYSERELGPFRLRTRTYNSSLPGQLPITSDEGRDALTPNELALARFVPMRMKRRGVEMRLIIDGDTASLARVDLPLLKATARAYRWSNDLLAGRAQSIGEIARREHLTARHVRRVMRLAFLAPTIVEAIVEGRQPADLSTLALTQRIELPPLWIGQEQALDI